MVQKSTTSERFTMQKKIRTRATPGAQFTERHDRVKGEKSPVFQAICDRMFAQ